MFLTPLQGLFQGGAALISCATREGAFAGLIALRAKAQVFKDFNDNKDIKDARREIKRDKSDKRDKGTRAKEGRGEPDR